MTEIAVVVISVVVIATTLYATLTLLRSAPPAPFDFSVGVTPPSRSIAPGDAASATVTAILRSGSPQDLQYSCADLPPGAACTFEPPACRPPCSTDLVLATSSNVPPGTYVVTIQGSNGTISRTVAFTLILTEELPPPPSFDFSVWVDPTAGTVVAGNSTSATVTAVLISGSTRGVQFSCEGLPLGAACTFVPPVCGPTCSASMSLSTSAGTPAGNYTVTIAGSQGSITRATEYSLSVLGPSTTLSFQKGGPFGETDDAYIYNGTPDMNFGSEPLLLVDAGNCIANGTICRSLLEFPDFIGSSPRQVPENATILSATLELNVTAIGGPQLLYQITEAWTEAAVTWNALTTPGMPGSKGPAISFNTSLGWIRVNVTGIVHNWTHGDANQGVFLWSESWDGVDYDSSESTKPPRLTVTFRSPPAALLGSPPDQSGPTELLDPGPSLSLPSGLASHMREALGSAVAAVRDPPGVDAFDRTRRAAALPGRAFTT